MDAVLEDREPGQRWRARGSEVAGGWHACDHWTQAEARGSRIAGTEFRRGHSSSAGKPWYWFFLVALPSRASPPRRHLGTQPAGATGRCITVWPELGSRPPLEAREPAPPFIATL